MLYNSAFNPEPLREVALPLWRLEFLIGCPASPLSRLFFSNTCGHGESGLGSKVTQQGLSRWGVSLLWSGPGSLAQRWHLRSTCSVSWAPILVNRLGSSRPLQDVSGFSLFQVTDGQHRGVRLNSSWRDPRDERSLLAQIPFRTWKSKFWVLGRHGLLEFASSGSSTYWALGHYLRERAGKHARRAQVWCLHLPRSSGLTPAVPSGLLPHTVIGEWEAWYRLSFIPAEHLAFSEWGRQASLSPTAVLWAAGGQAGRNSCPPGTEEAQSSESVYLRICH